MSLYVSLKIDVALLSLILMAAHVPPLFRHAAELQHIGLLVGLPVYLTHDLQSGSTAPKPEKDSEMPLNFLKFTKGFKAFYCKGPVGPSGSTRPSEDT